MDRRYKLDQVPSARTLGACLPFHLALQRQPPGLLETPPHSFLLGASMCLGSSVLWAKPWLCPGSLGSVDLSPPQAGSLPVGGDCRPHFPPHPVPGPGTQQASTVELTTRASFLTSQDKSRQAGLGEKVSTAPDPEDTTCHQGGAPAWYPWGGAQAADPIPYHQHLKPF